MYLKQLDIIGFKSFADKTRLTFEPGMTAIVGPNGCGKSNVSDAIRWVLGEQRPTAIRCSKLVDVVFNGTDQRKPLGLAEVSITFSDCEALLGTDYHEVTVTRRVYRDGSGAYFINKTASRLKDVQRLFMGTGIGTTSYSVMAQGQIDQILSSRPEDRRAVFEEAAGITKFKADRKEALRKIEQTEQNLLREADVLREMKRQIGSLQRQVGKAEKYRELREALRAYDVYLSKGKIQAFGLALETNAQKQRETEEALKLGTDQVNAAERASQQLHADLHALEERLALLQTQQAQAESQYTRAREVIRVNEQRMTEYRAWRDRDGREISATRQQLAEIDLQIESLAQKNTLLAEGLQAAQEALQTAEEAFRTSSTEIDTLRQNVQTCRTDSVSCDRHAAHVRDELAQLDEAARAQVLARARLTSEVTQLEQSFAQAQESQAALKARLETAQAEEAHAREANEDAENAREALQTQLEDLRVNFGQMQAQAAAKEAQLDLLNDAKEAREAFASGAQALLENKLGLPAECVCGTLADQLQSPASLRLALEAALRAWLDAVVVKDAATAHGVVHALLSHQAGSARLLLSCLNAEQVQAFDEKEAPLEGFELLLDALTIEEAFRPMAQLLLAQVYLVADDFTLDQIPHEAFHARFVTRTGVVYSQAGVDVWMPGSAAASPLSRRMLVTETTAQLEELKSRIAEGRNMLATADARRAACAENVRLTSATLATTRRAAAQAEGEFASVSRDVENLRARLAQVKEDLEKITHENAADDQKRASLTEDLESTCMKRDQLMDLTSQYQDELQKLEIAHGEKSRLLTEKRIATAQMESERTLLTQQKLDADKRKEELAHAIEGREAGIRGYEDSIQRLKEETVDLMGSLEELKQAAIDVHGEVEEAHLERATLQQRLAESDTLVSHARADLDRSRELKSRLEVAATEATMRRQNVYDHLSQEYGLDAQAVLREKDPDWKGGVIPSDDELDARVKELNAQIAALGPVNMVAIEEFRELEERYTKEKAQEADLIAAKEQILSLITNLNTKSSELFHTTFEQANANFQKMFTKLFSGGEARLTILENAEDPLECGIDIIARPPGKRPQSVTLLSGGERTMTAVALLFAIFMIKPAPFCLLDELDAALDDANIGRFVEALKDFLDRSQFLIITHNQHTIAGSDLVYGVSQQEKGVSRIISMRLADIGVKSVPEDVVTPESSQEKENEHE